MEENRKDDAMSLANQTLGAIFGNSNRRVWQDRAGLYGFAVDIHPKDLDNFRESGGPIQDWGSEYALWQAYMVISRHCEMRPENKHIHAKAKRFFEGGDCHGGKRFIVSYRNMVRDRNAEFRTIAEQVVEETRAALTGTLLAVENRDGLFYAAAKVELDAPRILNGTKRAILPVTGFHICGAAGTLKSAVENAIIHALGTISPDVEAEFFGYPKFSDTLALVRKDIENGMIAV